jgi:uncharacterized protein YecE (DUF72 family)
VEQFRKLEKLLSLIAAIKKDWKIAVEFRNKSWYTESTYQLLTDTKAALVIQDIPKSATPWMDHESDFMYIRFHGPTGNYRGSYSDDFLSEYAVYINEWIAEGKTIYLYFNNTAGDAFKNLLTINAMIKKKPEN